MPGDVSSKLLLANLCLFLPCYAPNSWTSVGYSDEKSETSRIKGLQICCCHCLHFKYIDHRHGIGDLCPREFHQYWHGDIRVLCAHPDDNLSCPHICPESKNENNNISMYIVA